MMYHASTAQFDRFADGLVCVTDDADAALGYLYGEAGQLYGVEVLADRLADEDDIMAAARELDCGDYGYAWEIVEDCPEVLAELKAQGFDGATYADLGPDNAYEHDTIMLFDSALATIIEREAIAQAA